MTWETLVCGTIEFKGIASDDDVLLVQNYLEFGREVEKIDVKNLKQEDGDTNTTIDFTSVNWISHINEDSIKEMLEKLKGKLEHYAITLHYLDGEYGINFVSKEEMN
jgi:hypothetical protein